MKIGKKKTRMYYDQEAENYKLMYEENYEKYPANLIRLKFIINRLKQNKMRQVLDVGCGTCIPMIKLLQEGFFVKGFDFSKDMVKMGKIELKKEGFDPNLVFEADLENDLSLPKEKFDAVLALGVFPHIGNELKALLNIKRHLNEDGSTFIEFRNELFSLFSANKYSLEFILNKIIQVNNLPKHLIDKVVTFYSKLYNVKKSITVSNGKISYNDIPANFKNPLTIREELFEPAGLFVDKIHFYHYHILPPHFEQKFPKLFRELSIKREKIDDWRGYFMSSAFVVEARKN